MQRSATCGCARSHSGQPRPALTPARRIQRPVRALDPALTHILLHSGTDAWLEGLLGFARAAPLALERVVYPCSTMNCGDMIYRSTLDPALRMEEDGISPVLFVLVGGALAYLTAAPGVLQGAFDTFVSTPLTQLMQPRLSRNDVVVGQKLAQGGFGTVYMGEAGASLPGRIRRGQKIIVKKANEFGEAEVWMNERMMRAAPFACPAFLAAYPDGPATLGTPLVLVWKFDGKQTLFDAMNSRDFPANVEKAVMGRELKIEDAAMRKAAVYKVLLRQMLTNLSAMHATGLVHRDIKPQNMLLSREGLKLIDFGAAADLRIGINYEPNEYLLDPRFAPPQQYIMSPLTPKAPPTPIAALLSPVLWRLNQPDRFDMYSVGVVLLQMAFPNLRSDNAIIAFGTQLEGVDYDLREWRRSIAKRASAYAGGFAVLDADGGAGWELLCQLVTFKPSQRLTARQALSHAWLSDQRSGNPLAAAGRALDSAVQDVIDSAAAGGLAEKSRGNSLSEAELFAELNSSADEVNEEQLRQRQLPRTIAWWQARARSEEVRPSGLLGRLMQMPGQSSKPPPKPRLKSAGTQRAFGSVDTNATDSSGEDSNGSSGALSGLFGGDAASWQAGPKKRSGAGKK